MKRLFEELSLPSPSLEKLPVVSHEEFYKQDFSLSPAQTASNSAYLVSDFLGRGEYGTVVIAQAVHQPEVAIKIMKQPKDFVDYQDSIRELCGLRSAGLLKGLVTNPQNQIGLVTDILGTPLGAKTIEQYGSKEAIRILRPVAEACRSMKGMHRDLKPSNILIRQNAQGLKVGQLIDYGLSTMQDQSHDPYVVTLWYRPPEVIMGLPYTKKVDVWSFGLILLNMLSGQIQFKEFVQEQEKDLLLEQQCKFFGSSKWSQLHQYLDNKNLECSNGAIYNIFRNVPFYALGPPKKNSESFLQSNSPIHENYEWKKQENEAMTLAVNLMVHCLKMNPELRFSWDQVLEHPFWTFYPSSTAMVLDVCTPIVPREPLTLQLRSLVDDFLRNSTRHACSEKGLHVYAGSYAMRIQLYYSFQFHCKLLHFSRETCAMAYWIYIHSVSKRGLEGSYALAVCILIAASCNEDFRITHHTWDTYAKLFVLDQEQLISQIVPTLIRTLHFDFSKMNWKAYFDLTQGLLQHSEYAVILWNQDSETIKEPSKTQVSLLRKELSKYFVSV